MTAVCREMVAPPRVEEIATRFALGSFSIASDCSRSKTPTQPSSKRWPAAKAC